jgi:hypothetical protein
MQVLQAFAYGPHAARAGGRAKGSYSSDVGGVRGRVLSNLLDSLACFRRTKVRTVQSLLRTNEVSQAIEGEMRYRCCDEIQSG